ncbi:MAG: diguanylate cyclase [Burkholderiaceae bacterium]|nr:diguanylate cyclase [Burkholderiaceae bacterium]
MNTVLGQHALITKFRPLADFSSCDIMGYIASVSGPAGTLLGSYRHLTHIARKTKRLNDFTCEVFKVIVQGFGECHGRGLLFIPLPEGAMETGGLPLARYLHSLVDPDVLTCDRIVLLVPDIDSTKFELVGQWLQEMRSFGFKLATQDFGCQLTGQRLLSKIGADFTFLNEEEFTSFDLASASKENAVAAFASLGPDTIIDGITNRNDLQALVRLGVRYGAGQLIGRPSLVPTLALPAAAHKAIAFVNQRRDSNGSPVSGHVLSRLLTKAAAVEPKTFSGDVFEMFENNPDLRALAVVEDGKPLGLISRYEMIDTMARSFRKEIYGHQPCKRFMDTQPLIIEIGATLVEVSNMVVGADPRHLVSGFIITEQGNYLGMGWVQDLMREVTAMQMESAKYANPLTQLPGNVPINHHIDNLLLAGEHCCVAWCDLDNFKPFNDVYGYSKGDDVIQFTARMLAEDCDPERDFIGHIGGDDFIVVFRSEDWRLRCERILRRFGSEIRGFFSNDDIERGGYVTENRKGEMEFHRLISLSIGLVEAAPMVFKNHLDISVVAAEVKKCAKAIPGDSLYVNKRHPQNKP